MAAANLVRWEIEPLDRPRRSFDDQLILAVPRLTQSLSERALSKAPGARLRRAALTRAVQRGFAANNRDDYDAMVVSYHPEVELYPPGRGAGGIGFDPVYRGPDGVRRFVQQWKSGFTRFRYEPREIADAGGGRFAVRVGMIGTLRGSDAEVSDEYGVVFTMKDGLAIRQENFYDWDEALATLRVHGD